MPIGNLPTKEQLRVPVVLVVGGPPDLVAAVEHAAVGAQVLVTRCAVADVTTMAAEIRPLVMVIAEEIFGFDPESFRALARDVSSRLLTVRPGQMDVDKLEARLTALMLEADDFESSWNGEPEGT
jgi:hypothetical protein